MVKVFNDGFDTFASPEWVEARQKYIRGSEDLCFWCNNSAACPYWEKIKDFRVVGTVFIPNCPFIPKDKEVTAGPGEPS